MAYDMPPPARGGAIIDDEEPRRPRVLLPTLLILAAVVVLFVLFTGFWTDKLWFDSVDAGEVFSTLLLTRALLFFVFGGAMALGVWASVQVAFRTRPAFRGSSPEQLSLERYRQAFEPARRVMFIVLPGLLGLLAGVSAAAEWKTYLQWRNAVPFGITDPQFDTDLSFFAFSVPWQRFVIDFLFAVVVLAFLGAVVVHYLYGGISVQSPGERLTRAASAQMSLLIAAFLLLKAWSYWLDRFELATAQGSLITGLTYTDVNAVLPAKTILFWVALLVAVLFIINAFRQAWTLPLLGLGLVLVTSLVIGGIWPAVVEQFQVKPSQQSKEEPYISRNIAATRAAYGLDKSKVEQYNGNEVPDKAAVAKDKGTLTNIRLLDPAIVSPTYRALQQIRGYYGFPDTLDVDRYSLDDRQRGAVVATRELNLDGIPAQQRNWINDHLIYTHGFGFVAAYDNTSTSDGKPLFFEADVPSQGKLNVAEPRIYFGEQSPTYSIVGAPEGTAPQELDYPDDASPTGQMNNTYSGSGGVPVGSFFNRLLYAVKYQDQNILLSSSVNSESQILYVREPRDRIEKVAPWLTLDGDPYPAVVGGRIVWIVDAYTTTDGIPYSSKTTLGEATADSVNTRVTSQTVQPRDQVNYIRNSVKAVVDAYEGDVTLYEWDASDPVLKTWEGAFPGLVKPYADIPTDLMAHLRYPEDIFKVQREILAKYHVTDPNSFYNGQDFWIVPDDPTRRAAGQPQPPYYLTLQMPGTSSPAFSLTTTFAPTRRQTLAAFMSVSSAPGQDYGTMRILQLPSQTTIPGPSQVQNNFESDPTVSRQLTLLRQGGSSVELGNLLSLPVGGGMLYVEPVYVQGTGAQGYPLLRYVMASFGQTVVMESTLPDALAKVFGTSTTPNPTPNPNPSTTAAQRLAAAIAAAQVAYEDGQVALAKGDWAAYGEAQKRVSAELDKAAAAAKEIAIAGGTTPTPEPSPSASGEPSPSPSATDTPTTDATPAPSISAPVT